MFVVVRWKDDILNDVFLEQKQTMRPKTKAIAQLGMFALQPEKNDISPS